MKLNLNLVTSYPIGTGIYRVFENYVHLGFYRNFYYIPSINFSNITVLEKPLYTEVKPIFLPPRLAYISSFYYGIKWKDKIGGNYIHVLEPGFFHLSRFNIPIIGTVHDLYPMNSETNKGYSNLYKHFYKKDMGYINNLLGVTAISLNTEKELHRFYPNLNITTIRHWTQDYFVPRNKNSCRDNLNIPRSKFILLNVSFKSDNKNIEFLGALMDLLDDRFLLIYLGNGIIHNIHRNRVMKLERFLDNNTLVELYNSADVYVAPSTAEGFNFPIIEAINCGVPVIASKIPIFEEVLFNSPYLLPLDKEMWVNEIVSLSNKQLAKDARSWYELNIGNYYREERGKQEFKDFFDCLGVK